MRTRCSTQRRVAAQAGYGGIQGQGGVWHAGAWLGTVSTRTALRSGFAVARVPGGGAAMGRPECRCHFGGHGIARGRGGAARMSTATLSPCIYQGRVMHHRLRPVQHRFVYRVFSLFLDLDELPC